MTDEDDPCSQLRRLVVSLRADQRRAAFAFLAPGSRAAQLCMVCGPSALLHWLGLERADALFDLCLVEKDATEALVELCAEDGGTTRVGFVCLAGAWRVALVCAGPPDTWRAQHRPTTSFGVELPAADCEDPEVARWLREVQAAMRLLAAHGGSAAGVPIDTLGTMALYHDICSSLLRAGQHVVAFWASLASDFFFFRDGSSASARVLKLLRAHTPRRRAQFAREVSVLVRLAGTAGIVRLEEHGVIGETPYHITERAPGSSVQRAWRTVRGDARWDAVDRAKVALRTVSIVADVHAQDVAHGDVAPDHIFVDDNGGVTLIDFGMACRVSELGDVEKDRVLSQEIRNLGLVFLCLLDHRVDVTFGTPESCVASWQAAWRVCLARSESAAALNVIACALARDALCREFLPARPRGPYASVAALCADVSSLVAAGRWL